MRFLALGDSYTIGESVQPAERWPIQLAALLKGQGVILDDPTLIARTGWTTDELSDAIDQANPQGPYELVSLLIGVNNQYRGRSVDEYRTQFVALLQRAIGYAGGQAGHVFVVSIPDWGVTPFAHGRDRAKIGKEIDAFNAINREEALKAGALYVDITPESRDATTDTSLVAGDGLHPSGKMYTAWAQLALPVACKALGLTN
jgi:lysophospholipase L1-like esterase